MRKPAFCICNNKGADQLHGNWAADQRLYFCFIDIRIPLLPIRYPKFQASSRLKYIPLCVREPKDRFSHDKSQLNFDHRNLCIREAPYVFAILCTVKKGGSIRITYPCNEHPLTPHFYIEKVGFTRVYIFFLFLLQNIDCGYSLEPPR